MKEKRQCKLTLLNFRYISGRDTIIDTGGDCDAGFDCGR